MIDRLPVAYNVFWIDLIIIENNINIWMLFPVHTRVEQFAMGIGGVNWRWSHKIRISFCVAASENSRHEHPPELAWTQMTYKGNASDEVQLEYSNPSGVTLSMGKTSLYNNTQLQFLMYCVYIKDDLKYVVSHLRINVQ